MRVCRRRHLQRRSQTTDPLYSASRLDDDDTLDRQHVPDSVIYVPTCNPSLKDTPQSLCSYHRYFRSPTGSGSDAIWPSYVPGHELEAGQTSFPLLVHPGTLQVTPRFRSVAMTSPELTRHPPPMSFRSADNLESASERDQSTSPVRQHVRADLVESVRRKRTSWTAAAKTDDDNERSERRNLCPCEHQATGDDCNCD